jgi:hypothetical protein
MYAAYLFILKALLRDGQPEPGRSRSQPEPEPLDRAEADQPMSPAGQPSRRPADPPPLIPARSARDHPGLRAARTAP